MIIFFFPSQGDPVTTLDSLWSHQRSKDGGMYKGGGGGPWPPRILNLYIYNYFQIFKFQSTKIRVGLPKYLNQFNDALKK